MDRSPHEFSDDSPVEKRAHDRLNRAPFADRVASMLRGLPHGTGWVVGIHGKWGDGKTTVLNLLRADLCADQETVVRSFNPWRLTDDDAMLRAFFSVLAEAIGASLSTTLERARVRAGKLAGFARLITKPLGWLWKPAESADDLLAKFVDVAARGDSIGLEQLRTRVIDQLRKSARQVVILIDDIDRLDKRETHMLFRLIKACADFPNVRYVLAFDDDVVARALGERYGGGDQASGRAFLEKIIQLPLKLPMAAREDLRALCFEKIDGALAAAEVELTEAQANEFISGFDRGAAVRLTTPRAAKRFGNSVLFALPTLKGETNPADLLLVEALRAFFPEVHSIVRDNHSNFSGVEREPRGRTESVPRAAELLKPVLDTMPMDEAEAVKALLVNLFPRLSHVYGNSRYGSDALSRWFREQRVSSPEYCPRYFAYAVPLNDVPDSEIRKLIDAADKGDAGAAETSLRVHLSGPKARRAIEKLRAVEAMVNAQAAETLAIVIAKLGKSMPNPPAPFGFAEPPSQAAILISHLLRRIPAGARRLAVGVRIAETADPLWFGVACLRWLHVTDKPEEQESNALTKEEIAGVRQSLVARIKALAATGDPLFDVDLPQDYPLLFEWRRAEGRDPVQAHLVRVFASDLAQVAKFLQSHASRSWGAGDVRPRVGELRGDQLKNIKLIIDLDTMAGWVRKAYTGEFEKPQRFPDSSKPIERHLAEQFMYIYNKWKKDGEPPDLQHDSDDPDE